MNAHSLTGNKNEQVNGAFTNLSSPILFNSTVFHVFSELNRIVSYK